MQDEYHMFLKEVCRTVVFKSHYEWDKSIVPLEVFETKNSEGRDKTDKWLLMKTGKIVVAKGRQLEIKEASEMGR